MAIKESLTYQRTRYVHNNDIDNGIFTVVKNNFRPSSSRRRLMIQSSVRCLQNTWMRCRFESMKPSIPTTDIIIHAYESIHYVPISQDPKHRDETESYIKQLEGEKKIPEGKQLVRPQPGFVAKAYKDGTKDEQGKMQDEKLFINIVQSEKIAEPTSVVSKEGTNWSLPYSLGPPHVEKDKKGDNVPTFDCCFHPEALKIAEKSKEFKDLLVQTAIEGIVETMRRQRQEAKIKPTFHIVKGLKYKQGVVPSMLVDIITTREKWKTKKSEETEATSDIIGNVTKKEMLVQSPLKQSLAEPIIKRGFLNSKNSTKEFYNKDKDLKDKLQQPTANKPNPLIQEIIPSTDSLPKPLIKNSEVNKKDALLKPMSNTIKSDKLQGVVDDFKKPRYTMKERGKVEMGDFSSNKAKVTSNRPAEIIYTFEVPLAIKPANISLDVEERTLKLSYEQVYNVVISLPYPVYDKKSSAKYNSKLKTLTVTIPVQAASIQYYESCAQTVMPEVEEIKHDVQSSKMAMRPQAANVHGKWVCSEVSEKQNESNKQMTEEIKKMAEAAKTAQDINRSVASYKPSPPLKEKEALATYAGVSFLPSTKYSGYRKGYVFKTGDEGLGYYLDQPNTSVKRISKIANKQIDTTVLSTTLQESTHLAFSFETRETFETIALLVQIPNIVKQTAKISFNSTSFSIKFEAPHESNKEKTLTYGMYFDQLQGVINASQSSYDIASVNMVVIIFKEVQGIWAKSDDIPLFRGVNSSCEAVPTKNTTIEATAEITKSNTTPSNDAMITKLQSLQFSQSNALFDLD